MFNFTTLAASSKRYNSCKSFVSAGPGGPWPPSLSHASEECSGEIAEVDVVSPERNQEVDVVNKDSQLLVDCTEKSENKSVNTIKYEGLHQWTKSIMPGMALSLMSAFRTALFHKLSSGFLQSWCELQPKYSGASRQGDPVGVFPCVVGARAGQDLARLQASKNCYSCFQSIHSSRSRLPKFRPRSDTVFLRASSTRTDS